MEVRVRQGDSHRRFNGRPGGLGTPRKAKPARLEAIRKANLMPRVRVLPASDELRAALRHPNGMGFRSTGSIEWPMDKFTQRRLREGSITIEKKLDEESNNKSEHRQQHQPHRRSAPPPAEA